MTDPPATADMVRRHLRIGWASLLGFAVLGGVLESMHAFKVDWYLAVGNDTRRMLWRLAHAHGTLLALVHIAFAATLPRCACGVPQLGSACLSGAGVVLPAGFLLAGIGARGGDPGLAIALVPLGLVLLLAAGWDTLRALRR